MQVKMARTILAIKYGKFSKRCSVYSRMVVQVVTYCEVFSIFEKPDNSVTSGPNYYQSFARVAEIDRKQLNPQKWEPPQGQTASFAVCQIDQWYIIGHI